MTCNFAQTIIDQSQAYPSKIAVRDGYQDLSYKDLSIRIRQVSNGLRSLGLRKGNHVIITMEDCVDWPVVFLACIYSGIVSLPLSNTIGPELFAKIVDFVDCDYIVAGDNINPPDGVNICTRTQIQEFYSLTDLAELANTHPDEPAWMCLSSGSTGVPKVAVHRHQALFEILEIDPRINFNMSADSVMLSVAKMSWAFGLHNSVTFALGLGATAVVIPDAPVAPVIFDYINRFNPTIVATSPSIIRRLLKADNKYTISTSVQHFHSSGEDLPRPMYDAFYNRFNLKLHGCIGMMETCTTYASNPEHEHDPCTVGKVLPKCKINLIDSEIYVSSPANACYYYKDYERSRQTFLGEWIRTGDRGYYNNQGNLVFVGRTDDVFKVNDLIVNPVEIESIIMQYPGVDQTAVAGVTNTRDVKEVHVFVVIDDEFDLVTFKEFLNQNLFLHQIPRSIHVVDQLPETVTNKKDRRTLAGQIYAD